MQKAACDFIDRKCPEQVSTQRWEVDLCLGMGKRGVMANGYEISIADDENVLELRQWG